MANYTPEQVSAAQRAGLISKEDAAYLLQELQGSGIPWGGIAGGTALGLAGAALGGKGGQHITGDVEKWGKGKMDAFAEKFPNGAAAAAEGAEQGAGPSFMDKMGNWGGQAAEFMGRENPSPKFLGKTLGDQVAGTSGMGMLGGGAGAGLGMAAGAWGGDAMMPAGEAAGVEGGGPTSGEDFDRDSALRALIDPSTPPDVKKQIMQMLQQFDQQNPPAEEGYGEGMPWGAMAGGALGAALGGAGGYAGVKRLTQGAEGSRPWGGDMLAKMGQYAPEISGGGLGALGLGGGAMAGGAMAPRRPSPYEDPLSVG